MPNNRDIFDAEKDLYIKEGVPQEHPRRTISNEQPMVPKSWNTPRPAAVQARKGKPLLLWFFLGSCAFAIIAFAVMTLSLFGSGNSVSNQKIDIEILGKSFAEGGEELEFEVLVRNRNNAALDLADLALQYPESGDSNTRIHEERRALDTVSANSERSEKFTARLYGAKDATVPVTARLEYRVSGSRSIFVKEFVMPVVLRSSPLSLTITGSDQVAQNQQTSFVFTITSQSAGNLANTALRVEYPAGFVPTKYTVDPDVGKNVWKLGDILPGEKKTIEVTGLLRGAQVNQALSVRAYVGQQDKNNERSISTLYASESKQLSVAASFLATAIIVNGNTSDTVAVSGGSSVSAVVRLQNVTGERVRDVEVTADLSGNLYDPASIQARGGFYDSNKNKIVWNRSTGSRVALLDPNQTEEVEFDFNQLPSGSGSTNITISIRGISVDGSVYQVQNVDSVTIKKTSAVGLSVQAARTGPFTNTGPIPPVVGRESTYTITLTINPPSSDLSGVTVSTTLPGYVTWKNQVSPSNQNVSILQSTGAFEWKAGTIPAGQSRSVSFQIGITPSLSQSQEAPDLTQDVRIEAYDANSGATVTSTVAGVTTKFAGADNNQSVVQES